MDNLWKWIMRLNAKAFCLVAILFFMGVAGFCAWLYTHPPAPVKDGGDGKPPEPVPARGIGTLDFVTNQLTAEALVIPVDPFRPTIEAIFTNETERAAFLKALKAAQASAAGIAEGTAGAKKEDPFAHLRKKAAVPGGLVGPNGKPMVIPKLSFMGFFQRPDGKQAALFYDSAENTTVFYDTGKQIHGVDIMGANVREAEIRFPDGTTRKLEIGGSVELAPEPAKDPPKKAAPVKPAAGKPGAVAAGKADAKKPKPAQQKGLQKKAVQQKAAQQKVAQQKPALQKKAEK